MNKRVRARRRDQTAIRGLRKSRDAALDFAGIPHADGAHVDRERRRGRLDRGELAEPGLAILV
jgi:hypothetical protein